MFNAGYKGMFIDDVNMQINVSNGYGSDTPIAPATGLPMTAASWEKALADFITSSAIDERTTRHVGYAISQKKRKRIEEGFGWLKTLALIRKVCHRGLHKVAWVFTFAAYNSVRMRTLLVIPVEAA
jgi:hypothetical protein